MADSPLRSGKESGAFPERQLLVEQSDGVDLNRPDRDGERVLP